MVTLEVRRTVITAKAVDMFDQFMRQSNITRVAAGNRVATLADGLIKECHERDRVLKSMDAMHLATAILYGVDEFYTNNGPLTGIGKMMAGQPGWPVVLRPPLPPPTLFDNLPIK